MSHQEDFQLLRKFAGRVIMKVKNPPLDLFSGLKALQTKHLVTCISALLGINEPAEPDQERKRARAELRRLKKLAELYGKGTVYRR